MDHNWENHRRLPVAGASSKDDRVAALRWPVLHAQSPAGGGRTSLDTDQDMTVKRIGCPIHLFCGPLVTRRSVPGGLVPLAQPFSLHRSTYCGCTIVVGVICRMSHHMSLGWGIEPARREACGRGRQAKRDFCAVGAYRSMLGPGIQRGASIAVPLNPVHCSSEPLRQE